MSEETNESKKRNSRTGKNRRTEKKNPEAPRMNAYFEPEIHHAPFRDKSRRPLSSEAIEDFEMDGE